MYYIACLCVIQEVHKTKSNKTDGETILSKEQVLNIATRYLEKLGNKYKTSYTFSRR